MSKQWIVVGVLCLIAIETTTSTVSHAIADLTASQPSISLHSQVPSLGFPNKTGSCFGSSQLNTLINFINQASANYRSDYRLNLKFIQENMDAAFGSQTERYNVFIQDRSLDYMGDYMVYPIGDGGCNFVSLTEGLNLINRNWSYLVAKYSYSSYPASFLYVGEASKGSGVTQDKQNLIQDLIRTAERRQFSCLCLRLSTITQGLKAKDGQEWSIICQTGDFTRSYLAAKEDQWIYTNPAECSYLLYVQ